VKSLKAKADAFRALHDGPLLVLPNAWDAASAAVIAQAGAKAIATSSGGVSWSLGRRDGQQVSRAEMVEVVRRIAAAVDVPVTADVEGGYGPEPADVAATVAAVVSAGAVGVNIEDSRPDGTLFDVAGQADRLRAARAAATRAGLPELWINARADVFLCQIGPAEGRLDDVLARASAYAQAGADSLFVIGLPGIDATRALVQASPLPINVMAGPGAPTATDFETVGVRRLSVGTRIAQAAYTLTQRAAAEMLAKGTYTQLEGALNYGEIDSLFQR
jgi:2-methylisocitrate lyase-like PEP mutase family enzyme